MTVWINNPFDFLPGEGARPQRYGLLCRALAQAGHQVVWWTSDWNHIKKARREEKCANARMRECGNGGEPPRLGEADPRREEKCANARMRECGNGGEGSVEIRLIKTMPYFKNVGIRRFVSHWLYARRWKKLAFGDSARPDLILCSLPPLETSGVMLELKKAFGCMGVVDIMDAWPETFERFFPRWALGLLRRQAARAYQGADGVSAVGAAYLSLAKQYLRGIPKPLHLCYHGIELSQWEEAGAKPKRADLLKVFYVGNMADAYDLKTVVQAVRELMKEGLPVRLDLAGDGPLRKSLEAMASDEGMMPRGAVGGDGAIITFHGVVLGSKLSELMHGADIGIIPMFPSSQVAIPYKLGDYAVHGLPVVNSLPGETCELLNQFKCGSSYVAGDVASLKQALTTAWRLKQEDALAFEGWRRNARRMAEELFDADRIYPEFVRWLEGLGEGGRV